MMMMFLFLWSYLGFLISAVGFISNPPPVGFAQKIFDFTAFQPNIIMENEL